MKCTMQTPVTPSALTPLQPPDYSYCGSELELFAHATTWKAYVRRQIVPYLGRRVLEVGAGLGGTTRSLCVGDHDAWILLEPDPGLASQAAVLCESRALPECCRVRVGTTEELGQGETFDSVLYMDVLEHIEHDQEEFSRAAALLSPGGYLVVLCPAHQFLYTEFDRAIGHFRRYTRSSMGTLSDPRLERVRLRYLDSVGMLASLANRTLLHQSMPTPRQIAFWDGVLVPCSRLLDGALFYRLGKSILGVWRRMP
jgi:SAM-dependent methyltransferase